MILFRQAMRPGSAHRAAVGAISAALAAQAALVVSGIVFARMLGPQSRGDLALVMLIPALIYQVGNLGLPLACSYYIAQDPGQTAAIVDRLRVFAFFQALAMIGVHAAVIAILIWPRGNPLRSAALITLPWTPALLVQQLGLATLQGQRRFLSFNVLRALPAFIYAGVAAAILIIGSHDLTLVVTLILLATVCLSALTLFVGVSRGRSSTGNTPTLRQLIVFGSKGALGSSYPVESFQLDQLLVAIFLTSADLGRYVVALSFINLPRFISQSIGFVAFSQVAAERDERSRRRMIWRYFWATMAITVAVVIALELLVPILLPLLFGNDFSAAVPVSRVLLVAAILLSARRILAEVLKGAGKPGAGSIAELISLVTLIPAVLLLIPSLHLVGVGVAVTFAAAISLALLLLLGRKSGRILTTPKMDPDADLIEEAYDPIAY